MTDDSAEAVRLAAADMRRHFRLPADELLVVVPPAGFVESVREGLADDPTLIVSDEKERR